MTPVGRNGVTRLDVLLSFGTYVNQITPAIEKNIDAMTSTLANL